jgi:hypothetical protein
MDNIRLELDTHYFGTLQVIRAFADQPGRADEAPVLDATNEIGKVVVTL